MKDNNAIDGIYKKYINEVQKGNKYFGTAYTIEIGNHFRTIAVQYYEKGMITVVAMIALLDKISKYERGIVI